MDERDEDNTLDPGPADEPELYEAGLASVVLADPRDDVAAICGRIDATPTYAVVIHAPEGNRQLASELGMRRLVRHAEDTGKSVAIATRSGVLAARARQVGVPVAARPDRVRWDGAGKRVFRLGRWSALVPSFGGYVQAVVLVVAGLGIAGAAIAVGPGADITISPPTETLTATVSVTASRDRDEVDLAALKVPAEEISASQRFTLAVRTTGKALVDTRPAKVTLTLSNPGTADLSVPAGALVRSADGQEFTLDAVVNVKAAGTAGITATASRPGVKGNVAAAAGFTFQDAVYAGLTVSNPQAAAGGATEERQAVDAADIVAIRALAKEFEKSEAIKKAVLKARPRDAALLRTAQTTVSLGQPSAGVGSPADVLLLDVDVSVKAVAVPADALELVALKALSDKGARGEFVPGSVTAVETGASQSSSDDGTFRTEFRIAAEFARNLTRESVIEAVKGKGKDEAKSILRERYGIQDAEVDLTPGWSPWLPRLGFRINVELRPRPTSDAADTLKPNDATTTPGPTPAPANGATPRP